MAPAERSESWGGDQFEGIAALGFAGQSGAGGKFENGMRGQASGQAPCADCVAHLADAVLTVEIDEIDRKAHEKRVHRFTGHNPEAFSGGEPVAAQQTFTPASA